MVHGRRSLALLWAASLFAAGTPVAAQDVPVDLELVLAVDTSSSIDEGEFRLQMDGLAAALRDVRVWRRIEQGRIGRIGVALTMWGDATVPVYRTGWFTIGSASEAAAFADHVAGLPRGAVGGTGIGAGIAESIRMFERNGLAAPRQVVDVSGDGPETPAREIVVTMPTARAMALTRGVTINGLVILNEAPDLAAWYRAHVIAGPRSFVITAADFDAFREAMVRKLIREIGDDPRVSALFDGACPPRPRASWWCRSRRPRLWRTGRSGRVSIRPAGHHRSARGPRVCRRRSS